MLLTRKRRGRTGSLRSALLDAVARTEGLGLTVVGCYDAAVYASTTSWADARGTVSGGPTITLTGSPTLSNGVLTFDGATQYGRNATVGRLNEITDDCTIVFIGTAPTTSGQYIAELSSGAAFRNFRMARGAGGIYVGQGGSEAVLTGPASGVHCIVGRRTSTNATGIRLDSAAEVTAAPAISAVTVNRLTVAGTLADTPGGLGAGAYRTLVICKGSATTAVSDIWVQYGRLRGAT